MNHDDQIRLFVAVPLPQSAQEVLSRIQTNLQQTGLCKGRYIDPSQAHLTLVFIGSVAPSDVDHIKNSLKTISFPALSAKLGNVDTFKKHTQVRIIYLDIICPELTTLARIVKESLSPWIPKEERPFVSHVTIMRVKKVTDATMLISHIHAIPIEPHPFCIDSFLLMESTRESDGPVYHELAKYPLLNTATSPV